MPKRRASESTVEILAKKLKKLENEVKRYRRPRRRRPPPLASDSESSFSSSSSSSSCSTSGSRSASRESTPSETHNDRHPTEPTSPATPPEGAAAQAPPRAHAPPTAPPAPPANDAAVPPVAADAPPPPPATDQDDTPLDPEILEILGNDPTAVQKYGPEINKDLANRFNHITTAGLDKEGRKLLIEKYLVPANCSQIAAPRLNPEIKAAVPDSVVKRDKAIEARQTEIAAAISCLSQAISSQLADKHTNHDLLKRLMDSARILCDIQYSESISRRNFALYSLKREVKEQLTNTKIDTLLFGEDLPETLKTAKAVTKSSSDLKIEVPKKSNAPKYSSKTLNWKAAPSNRKAAAGPSRRQPPAAASSQPPPASSSRNSSRPQRSRQPRPRR